MAFESKSLAYVFPIEPLNFFKFLKILFCLPEQLSHWPPLLLLAKLTYKYKCTLAHTHTCSHTFLGLRCHKESCPYPALKPEIGVPLHILLALEYSHVPPIRNMHHLMNCFFLSIFSTRSTMYLSRMDTKAAYHSISSS